MPFQPLPAKRALGAATLAILGLLLAGLLGVAYVAPVSAAAPVDTAALQPVAQCGEAVEVAGGWDPYMGHVVAVDQQYYCGPGFAYPPEWYAAHIVAYPQYYTPYPVEPTQCGTYHFFYENVWYCYTGP